MRRDVRHGEGGMATMEVLFAIILVLMPMFMMTLFVGRFALARSDLQDAARAGARAAAVQRTNLESDIAGADAATLALERSGLACTAPPTVDVQPNVDLATGNTGSFTVTVECEVSLAGLGVVIAPSSTSILQTATFTEPVDAWSRHE